MMSNMEPTLNLQSESTTREADVDKEPLHETDEDTAHSSSSLRAWIAYSHGVVVGDKLYVESSGWELAGEDSSSRTSTDTVQHSVMDIPPTTSSEIETSCIKTRD